MMHAKAILFGDIQAAAAILKSSSPRYQKQVGCRVRNFDADVWAAESEVIAEAALYAKFSQNPALAEELLTAPGHLVEASPYDRIWGIGLAATDPRAQRRATWRGTNRLGVLLDRMRDRLLDEEWATFVCLSRSLIGVLPPGLVAYVRQAL